MSRDAQMILDNAAALTVTAVSTNAYQLSKAPNGTVADPTVGVYGFSLVFHVTTAFTAAGAATMQFKAIADSNTNLTTNPEILAQSALIPVASLTLGTVLVLSLPQGSFTLAQQILTVATATLAFIGAGYVVATGPMTAGNMTCELTPSEDVQMATQGAANYIVL